MSTVIKAFTDLITTIIPPNKSGGYRIYSALLNQTGTADPVAIEQENNIGKIVWTRAGIGLYNATLIGTFKVGKTTLDVGPLSGVVVSVNEIEFFRVSDDVVVLKTTVDAILVDQLVTIKIY